MYVYKKDLNTNDLTISFCIPLSHWCEINQSDSWKQVTAMISKAQRAGEVEDILLNQEDLRSHVIQYKDIPLMQETIQRIDRLHKRMMISLILPTISMLLSVSALILALT